jgi:hypothetical protein
LEAFLEPFFDTPVSAVSAFAATSLVLANCHFKALYSQNQEKIVPQQVQGIWQMLQSHHIVLGRVLFDHQ